MRILYVTQNFMTPDDPGGIRHFAHVSFLASMGHDVTVLTADRFQRAGILRSPADISKDGARGYRIVRVHVPDLRQGIVGRIRNYVAFMSRAVARGRRERGGFDVVLASSPPLFTGVTGVLLALLKRARLVLEIRDLWPQSAILLGFLRNRLLILLSRRLEQWLYARAAAIVCLTEGIAEQIGERFSHKVHVVRNGVDRDLIERAFGAPCDRRRGPRPDDLVAAYAGSHGVNNALDDLVDAAEALKDEPIRFVLIGEGSQTARLQDRCQQLNLANVSFVGAVARRSVPSWLHCADVLLWPVYMKPGDSELIELKRGAVPNKLFDYLAVGKPVVTSVPDDGEAASLLRMYGTPHFVGANGQDFADCLRTLVRKRPLDANAEGATAFRTAYDRTVQAQALAGILEDCLELPPDCLTST